MDILIYNLEKMNTIPSDFDFTRNLNTIQANSLEINNRDDQYDFEDSLSQDNSNNENYRNGRWQPCEHYRFIKGCLQYGNNWKKVSPFPLYSLKGNFPFKS